MTRPQFTPRAYQPVDKRIDHWMATYSFNLMLLTLACGGKLKASELFTGTDDPVPPLRNTSLQWRAAIPAGIWLDSLEHIPVVRGRAPGVSRDLRLVWDVDPPALLDKVDLQWLQEVDPGSSARKDALIGYADVWPAVRSMHLSGSLTEDLLRHAVEPLLFFDPDSVITAVHDAVNGTGTVAHNMIRLWINSSLQTEPEKKLEEYRQAALTLLLTDKSDMSLMMGLFLRCLVVDAGELPPQEVENLLGSLALSRDFQPGLHTALVSACRAAANLPGEPGS